MAEDVNKEIDQLKSDIASLREDLASLVKVVRTSGAEKSEELYERATERAREASDAAQRRASESVGAFGREVEQRPLTSVATAMVTGFVIGMLLDRRH